jgi:hypothetical protein
VSRTNSAPTSYDTDANPLDLIVRVTRTGRINHYIKPDEDSITLCGREDAFWGPTSESAWSICKKCERAAAKLASDP